MRVAELITEELTVGQQVKAISAECKAIAKKFQLTLVAGMGWPNIVKDGGWMGGGLGPWRGIKDEDAWIKIEKRRIGFIKDLARKLEGYVAEGRKVKIGRGASRSVHQEDAIAGQVEEQLMKNLVEERPPGNVSAPRMPCVVWFVGMLPGATLSSYASISVSMSSGGVHSEWTIGGKAVYVPAWTSYGYYGNILLTEEDRTLKTFLSKMSRLVTGKYDYEKRIQHFNEAGADFVIDLLLEIFKAGPNPGIRAPEANYAPKGVSLEQFLQAVKVKARGNHGKTQKDVSLKDLVQISFNVYPNKVLPKDVSILDTDIIRRVAARHGFKA